MVSWTVTTTSTVDCRATTKLLENGFLTTTLDVLSVMD